MPGFVQGDPNNPPAGQPAGSYLMYNYARSGWEVYSSQQELQAARQSNPTPYCASCEQPNKPLQLQGDPTTQEIYAAQAAHPGTVDLGSERVMLTKDITAPRDAFYGLYTPWDAGRYNAAKEYFQMRGLQIGGGSTAPPGTTGSVHVDAGGNAVPNIGSNERTANPGYYDNTTSYTLIAGSPKQGFPGQDITIPRAEMPFQPKDLIVIKGLGNGGMPSYAVPTSSIETNNPWNPSLINIEATKRVNELTDAAVLMRAGYNPSIGGATDKESANLVLAYEAGKLGAAGRGDIRGAFSYENLEQKAAQNVIERASAYHDIAQQLGIPVAANPHEYQADLYVEYLKGTPRKDSERFSPVSGALINLLPPYTEPGRNKAGLGLQQNSWDAAISRLKGEAVSFANYIPAATAIKEVIDTANMGPYGELYGGNRFQGQQISRPLGEQVVGPQLHITTGLPTIEYNANTNASQGRLIGGKVIAASASIIPNTTQENQPTVLPVGEGVTITSYPAPFISSPNQSSNPFFEGVSKAISNLPILGDFYRIGGNVDKDTVSGVKNFVLTAPVLSNIAKGGELYAAMKDYESHPSFTGPARVAGKKYEKLSAAFVGPQTNEELTTYGVAAPLLSLGEGYRNTITKPIEGAIGKGPIQSAVLGVVDVPGLIPETAGATIVGGERTARNIQNVPGLAAAGGAMAIGSFIEDPIRFAASVAATYGILRVGGLAAQKGIGVVRTAGMEYVPLENIGYGPEGRYPLNPTQSGSMLSRSFKEGILYPEPKAMAEGGEVPYLHGKGGIPAARLPNAQPGEYTLYTALESSSRTRGVPVGESYVLQTSGGSEVRGMYGAPILQSYFLKVGNKPQMIGFELPFKTPTAYSTVVPDVEAIPKVIRRTTAGGDWSTVNNYITQRSINAPAGQAYMPLIKAEYEAIAPDFTAIEITGRNYYTKVGGFGESHILGTRIPIVEQRTIGFDIEGAKAATAAQGPSPTAIPDYYRPPARIGGYSLTGASGISMGSGLSSRNAGVSTRTQTLGSGSPARSGGKSTIQPLSRSISGTSVGERPSGSTVGSSDSSYKRIYNPSEFKGIQRSISQSSSSSIVSPLISTKIPSSKAPSSVRLVSTSTTPTSPRIPPYTPPYTPPGSPTPPEFPAIFPPSIIPPFNSGGSGSRRGFGFRFFEGFAQPGARGMRMPSLGLHKQTKRAPKRKTSKKRRR